MQWPWVKSAREVESRIDSRLQALHDTAIASLDLDGIERRFTALEAQADQDRKTFSEQIAELDKRLVETRQAVAEGIERVDRSERRIKATVTRARKELESRGYTDPGLEAEDHELRLIDGVGSEDGGVHAVSGEMGEVEGSPSSVRGVSSEQLRRIRGI